MGDEIAQRHFNAEDYTRFRRRLDEETDAVQALFETGGFSQRGDIAGFELEAWLVDADGNPPPRTSASSKPWTTRWWCPSSPPSMWS